MPKKRADELPPNVRKRGRGYTYRYEVPFVKPDGTPGKKQTDTKQYPTPLEAYQSGILIEAELIKGTYVDPTSVTFEDWVEKGLEMHVKTRKLKPKTKHSHRTNLSHAIKYFKGRKLRDISSLDYQNYLLYLLEDRKLSNNTIAMYHSSAKILWELAVKHKLLQRDVTDVEVPRHQVTVEDLILSRGEEVPEYLEKEQLALLLRTIKSMESEQTETTESFATRQLFRAIFTLAYTGLRVGEMCALTPDRIDKRNSKIFVAATLDGYNGYSGHKLGTPKTSKPRYVDIPQTVIDILDSQIRDVMEFRLLRGSDYYRGSAFVFVGYKEYPGWPLATKELGNGLRAALVRVGLPLSITPHKLRHTYASLSAEAGMALEEIQAQLGHKSDKVTRQIYLHVTESRRKANVQRLDNLLSPLIRDI